MLAAVVLAAYTSMFGGDSSSVATRFSRPILLTTNPIGPDLKPGKWGGSGIVVTVEKKSTSMIFDCADAEIEGAFKTRKSGSFNLTGNFTQKGHGPIRLDDLPKSQSAKFTGKVTGKKMTLKITLTDTDEVIGEYTLERDKESKMHYCR